MSFAPIRTEMQCEEYLSYLQASQVLKVLHKYSQDRDRRPLDGRCNSPGCADGNDVTEMIVLCLYKGEYTCFGFIVSEDGGFRLYNTDGSFEELLREGEKSLNKFGESNPELLKKNKSKYYYGETRSYYGDTSVYKMNFYEYDFDAYLQYPDDTDNDVLNVRSLITQKETNEWAQSQTDETFNKNSHMYE
ncbi:MAG: hypothetical protein PHG66_00960 [Candidatus Colwellbacteria bacterium]|nr:hypothetical protein [Candidatus Colwellbacteria bacterium]